MKRSVKMKRIREILKSFPEDVKLNKDEKVFITAQLLCNVLDYVTTTNEQWKITDLYIASISYNSSLYNVWFKELFNKISFCQLVSYSAKSEYEHYNVTKRSDGLYIEPIRIK